MAATKRKTLPLPATTVAQIEEVARLLNALDPDELRFARSSRRSVISASEVADVSLRLGLRQLLVEHGLDYDPEDDVEGVSASD